MFEKKLEDKVDFVLKSMKLFQKKLVHFDQGNHQIDVESHYIFFMKNIIHKLVIHENQ
jgi:hypothetical protein